MKGTVDLELLERGVQMLLIDKLVVRMQTEQDLALRAHIINAIGSALGEVLDTIEYPIHWRRFLKRKDCPEYLKEIKTVDVNVYYPKIKLPKEPYWLSFTRKL